jgi:hypothetical protein
MKTVVLRLAPILVPPTQFPFLKSHQQLPDSHKKVIHDFYTGDFLVREIFETDSVNNIAICSESYSIPIISKIWIKGQPIW